MAIGSVKIFTYLNGEKVTESKNLEPIFKSLSVSADGNDNGLDITEVSGKFYFNGKILSGVGTASATGQAVEFDQYTAALSGKANTSHSHTSGDITDFATAAKSAAVADAINDGTTDVAPSQNAVFDALALKVNTSAVGAANGVASLDSGGKVPVAQLPNSVMEYKGTWAASTNTPSLADGVGNAGDVYIASDAGTVDFGSGDISFLAGDWVMYSGSVWQKSVNSNAVASVFGRTGAVAAQSGDYTASQITNVPAGNIAAVTVQAALNELDSEKAAVSHTHVAADITDFVSAAKSAAVADAINDGTTDVAPSQNAVFDALALKKNVSDDYKSLTNNEGGATAHVQNKVVYLSAAGQAKLAQADSGSIGKGSAFYLVKDASIADQAAGNYWKPEKGQEIAGFGTGLTIGSPIYLAKTAGGYTQDISAYTTGDKVVSLGKVISATDIIWNPEYEFEIG